MTSVLIRSFEYKEPLSSMVIYDQYVSAWLFWEAAAASNSSGVHDMVTKLMNMIMEGKVVGQSDIFVALQFNHLKSYNKFFSGIYQTDFSKDIFGFPCSFCGQGSMKALAEILSGILQVPEYLVPRFGSF